MTMVEQEVSCPKCGGKMWDNRASKKNALEARKLYLQTTERGRLTDEQFAAAVAEYWRIPNMPLEDRLRRALTAAFGGAR